MNDRVLATDLTGLPNGAEDFFWQCVILDLAERKFMASLCFLVCMMVSITHWKKGNLRSMK